MIHQVQAIVENTTLLSKELFSQS